jgi:ABC-type multidrug transport system fused ATPase/permease subunit
MLSISTKLRHNSFWFYQLSGWLLFYAADVFLMLYVRNRDFLGVLEESLQDVMLLVLTSLLRLIYRRYPHKELSIYSFVVRISFWSIFVGFVWEASIFLINYAFKGTMESYYFLETGTVVYWTFYIATLTFGWSVFYFGFKFWIEWGIQRDQAEKASVLAQRAQLQMLRYQLNPHFLFNALNSIRALMAEDTRNAKEMITELSEFLRYSLLGQDRSFVTLREELEAVRHYLSIEKKRFEEKIQVEYEIESSAENCMVPSFLIHPVIENAVKFGMQSTSLPLKIVIKAAAADSMLRIEIANSGNIMKRSSENGTTMGGTGAGLENVKARIENAFPGNNKFEIFEKDGFVHVILEFQSPRVEPDENSIPIHDLAPNV